VISTLLHHLSECLVIPQESRSKAHDQMIELIITLIRNLTSVPDAPMSAPNFLGGSELRSNLQFNFLQVLSKTAFDALVYLCQDFSTPLMKKLNIVLLEIFFNIFSSFCPKWVMSTQSDDSSFLKKMLEREKFEKAKRLADLSTRHSRFDAKLVVKRKFDGTHKIVTNPSKIPEINTGHNQMKKPKIRKIISKSSSIWRKSLNEDLTMMEENLVEDKTFKTVIRDFALDFLNVGFEPLIESLYDEIYKGSDRVEDKDRIAYLLILSFGVSLSRHRYYALKSANPQEVSDPVNHDIRLGTYSIREGGI
jgi:timeless